MSTSFASTTCWAWSSTMLTSSTEAGSRHEALAVSFCLVAVMVVAIVPRSSSFRFWRSSSSRFFAASAALRSSSFCWNCLTVSISANTGAVGGMVPALAVT